MINPIHEIRPLSHPRPSSMHTYPSADEGNESAANILQHLATILSEERDKKLPAETRLLRMLLRTTKQEERLSMMLEKLLLANPPPRPKVKDEETGEEREEEPFWGQPEVRERHLCGGDCWMDVQAGGAFVVCWCGVHVNRACHTSPHYAPGGPGGAAQGHRRLYGGGVVLRAGARHGRDQARRGREERDGEDRGGVQLGR